MILNQIDVIYVSLYIFECFTTILTCMIEFRLFKINWGRNQSFDRAEMVKIVFSSLWYE